MNQSVSQSVIYVDLAAMLANVDFQPRFGLIEPSAFVFVIVLNYQTIAYS